MSEWFSSLDSLQRIFSYVAIPATAVLLLQTILIFFGIGDAEADDGDIPADSGLTLFSVRGIVAMLCIGGWSGIVLGDTSLSDPIVILLAVIIGLCALFGMALLIRLILKLQSSGNIQLANAIGKVGQVYLTIPANGTGSGKVNIIIQETFTEVQAVTRDQSDIKTGEVVRVVSTDELGMFVVERVVK